MNGDARSSSSEKPSTVCQAGLTPHEIAVERGHAEQIQRQLEEAIEVVAGPLPLDVEPIWLQIVVIIASRSGDGFEDVAAEELHHALHAAALHDRQGERGMEADAFGDRGAREVVVAR